LLQLNDDMGTILRVERKAHSDLRLYGAAGGVNLTREQGKMLRNWLDDGDYAVCRHENDRLRQDIDLLTARNERLRARFRELFEAAWWVLHNWDMQATQHQSMRVFRRLLIGGNGRPRLREEVPPDWFEQESIDAALQAVESRSADAYRLLDTGTELPPDRSVRLRDVIEALENGYHPQNPSVMHPADFVTLRFGGEGHEGLRDLRRTDA
jgi:hypothetical protein